VADLNAVVSNTPCLAHRPLTGPLTGM
jgi:hypothetical protein